MKITSMAVAAVAAAFSMLANAEPVPSVEAEAYYRLHFDGSGEGAYEWPERGLLFIKSVTPSKPGAEGESMAHTRKLMRDWLAGKAAAQRQDPELAYGLDLMRRTCREYIPDIEYTATWNFSGETCAFSYERGKMREVVTVVWRDELLKALPKAFLEPVSDDVWRTGMRTLAVQRYLRQNDLAFMWRTGALDCYVASADSSLVFPDWGAEDIEGALKGFYDEASTVWGGVESPAHDEYAEVDNAIRQYVLEGERAVALRGEAVSAASPAAVVSFSEKQLAGQCTTNVTVVCTTNLVENAETKLRTDRFTQAPGRMALPITVCSNAVDVVAEESDDHVITEVETITIVRTIDRIVSRVSTTYSGDPRFEKLFLSGGYLANSPAPQTERGKAAVRAFAAKISAAEREGRILDALRENPGDKELWNLYGRILQGKGEHCGAVICFRNALRLDRCYDFALTNLAISYDALGKNRLACSIAMLVQGITTNQWCIGKLEGILAKER